MESAKVHYGALMGWTLEPFALPDGEYYVAKQGDRYVAGLGSLETGAITDAGAAYWFSFVAVENVDACVEAARTRGFTVVREPVDVPNVGRVAVVRDPAGAALGWMQGASAATL